MTGPILGVFDVVNPPKLRCQPGDLAVIVRTGTDLPVRLLGRIVEVDVAFMDVRQGRWFWRLKAEIPLRGTWTMWAVADDVLRPLRDNDGQDETLRAAQLEGGRS